MPLAYSDTAEAFVVPLNSTIGSRVLDQAEKFVPEDLLSVFIGLANGIASRVNRKAIRRRTPEARLAGRLFDYDQVVSGFLGGAAPKFYAETYQAWRWNARYWEQVALLNLARFQSDPTSENAEDALAQAIQHARHAVSLDNHPLSLTTLSKVLLAQLGYQGISNTETYNEAFGNLVAAIELEQSWAVRQVHSFITLFRGTRDFVTVGGQLSPDQVHRLKSRSKKIRFISKGLVWSSVGA